MDVAIILEKVEKAKEFVSDESLEYSMEKYRRNENSTPTNEVVHQRFIRDAIALFDYELSKKDSANTITAALYLLLCVYCVRRDISIFAAETDLGISRLKKEMFQKID